MDKQSTTTVQTGRVTIATLPDSIPAPSEEVTCSLVDNQRDVPMNGRLLTDKNIVTWANPLIGAPYSISNILGSFSYPL